MSQALKINIPPTPDSSLSFAAEAAFVVEGQRFGHLASTLRWRLCTKSERAKLRNIRLSAATANTVYSNHRKCNLIQSSMSFFFSLVRLLIINKREQNFDGGLCFGFFYKIGSGYLQKSPISILLILFTSPDTTPLLNHSSSHVPPSPFPPPQPFRRGFFCCKELPGTRKQGC